jgi:hypothetical protein
MGAPAVVVRHDGFVRRDKLWRGAGLALPVFAARTRNSVGVGEFLDLMQLVDFADTAGVRLLQVRRGRRLSFVCYNTVRGSCSSMCFTLMVGMLCCLRHFGVVCSSAACGLCRHSRGCRRALVLCCKTCCVHAVCVGPR